MKMSRRARRMERYHEKHGRGASLNLVSLMDIFTILVFFLLTSSSDVEVLPSTKAVHLPESIAVEKPRETVLVTVTDAEILVQGRQVTTVADGLRGDDLVIEPLRAALVDQAARTLRAPVAGTAGPEVTILGERAIPYRLLKRVMATCTKAEYGAISLAVLQRNQEHHG